MSEDTTRKAAIEPSLPRLVGRPIKFRVWHTNAKRFLESGDTDPDDSYWFGLIDEPLKVCEMSYSEFQRSCAYTIIQQFTGLKDKNGKEIYEGDILHDIHGNIGEVRWISREDGWDYSGWYAEPSMMPFEKEKTTEVIGNIFENPELLSPNDQSSATGEASS